MTTATTTALATLTAAILFCGGASADSTPAAPNEPASRAAKAPAASTSSRLRVDVTVKYEKGGTTGVLSSGDVLTNDDNYRVIFKPTHDSYVYVYQIDANQRVDTIFPNPKYTAATNPVTTKIVYSVPPEGRWLRLDQTRGPEEIIVVAADTALADPKDIALRVRATQPRGAPRADEAAAASGSEDVFAYRLTFEHR